MLYTKLKIHYLSKYADFEKLYNHMCNVRVPGFEFEKKALPDINWDNMTDDEREEAMEKMLEFDDIETQESDRYKVLIPDYADSFLGSYFSFDERGTSPFGFKKSELLNYLEFSFEVDMDNLEKLNETNGIVEFSAGNYPFGGIERFLMTLKAFGLQPIECFDGFSIKALDWTTSFEYSAIELPEKTKEYLKK